MMSMDGVLREFVEISKLMYMTIPTQFLISLPFIVSNFLAGHFSTKDFNTVGLSLSFIYTLALSPIYGFSTAAETLLSQTNGSGNRNYLGVLLQRSVLIGFNLCFILSSLLVHAEYVLKLFGQDAALTHMVHEFIFVSLPFIFLYSVLLIQIKYLQCQKIVKCVVYIGIVANILHVGYGILFTYVLGLGAKGTGIAMGATFLTWNILLVLYIVYSGCHHSTWTGFSMTSFDNWRTYLSIGGPAAFMMLLETFCFEVYTLLVGLIGAVELSAYLIINSIFSLLFNIACGALTAGTIQIGNYLGSGDHKNSKTAAIATLYISVGLPLMYVTLLLAVHQFIPYIYTSNKSVISMVKPLIIVQSVVQFVDGISIISGSALRACGKQPFLAVVDVLVFGVIGIPLSLALMFWTPLKVFGTLTSMTITLIIVCCIIYLRIYFINWQQEAIDAIKRTEIESVSNRQAGNDETNPILSQDQSRSRLLIIVKICLCPLIFVASLISVLL